MSNKSYALQFPTRNLVIWQDDKGNFHVENSRTSFGARVHAITVGSDEGNYEFSGQDAAKALEALLNKKSAPKK